MEQIFNPDKNLILKYQNGNIDTILVQEKVILETSVGKLVPRYTLDDDAGRKKEAPVKFYKLGGVKSLPLEEATPIPTALGTISAELVTFYKSGALRRVFPLNGQVTGFWTEANELELAPMTDIKTSVGSIAVKPIYFQFYETGELESILFWPKEKADIKTAIGDIKIHKGICFHKNGAVKGFEPVGEITVETPLGSLKVYDPDPNGMQAENHSISFDENMAVESVITSSSQIIAYKDGIEYKRCSPKLVTSYCNDDAFFTSPLKIVFGSDSISFNNINEPAESLPRDLDYKIADFLPFALASSVGCGG